MQRQQQSCRSSVALFQSFVQVPHSLGQPVQIKVHKLVLYFCFKLVFYVIAHFAIDWFLTSLGRTYIPAAVH